LTSSGFPRTQLVLATVGTVGITVGMLITQAFERLASVAAAITVIVLVVVRNRLHRVRHCQQGVRDAGRPWHKMAVMTA